MQFSPRLIHAWIFPSTDSCLIKRLNIQWWKSYMIVWYLDLKLTMHWSSMVDSEPWSVYPIHLQIVRAFGLLNCFSMYYSALHQHTYYHDATDILLKLSLSTHKLLPTLLNICNTDLNIFDWQCKQYVLRNISIVNIPTQ
jgi:hypothetical protein